MKILIVDPDAGLFENYRRLLSQESDFKLSFETAGKVALESIAKKPPDLVIVEQQLNDIDIFEFLKGTERDNIPVLVVSAEPSERMIVECLRMGAGDYLSKANFKFGMLRPVIRRAALEYPHFKTARFIEGLVAKDPTYRDVNEEVRDLLLVERKELARKRAQESEQNPYARHLEEGLIYDFLHFYIRLRMPPEIVRMLGLENANSLKISLFNKFLSIPGGHGGDFWRSRDDFLLYGFDPDDAMSALAAALQILAHTHIRNFTLENTAENISIIVGMAEGQAIFHDDRGLIVSEAMEQCAALADRPMAGGEIIVSESVYARLTERAKKYFRALPLSSNDQKVYAFHREPIAATV